MMKMIGYSLLALSICGPIAAQTVLRQRIEAAGSQLGEIFSKDQVAAEIRTLESTRGLKIAQIDQKRRDIETLRLELEQIDIRLVELGVIPQAPAAPDGYVAPPALNMEKIQSCPLGPNGDCIF